MRTDRRANGMPSRPRLALVSLERSDLHIPITIVGLIGLGVAVVLALAGLPAADLHSHAHQDGIMDPFCGGTRAAYLTTRGDLVGAWRYNPLGIVAVLAAVGASLRMIGGLVTGHWITLTVAWTRQRRLLATFATFGLFVALEIRQQMQADLLMSNWTS